MRILFRKYTYWKPLFSSLTLNSWLGTCKIIVYIWFAKWLFICLIHVWNLLGVTRHLLSLLWITWNNDKCLCKKKTLCLSLFSLVLFYVSVLKFLISSGLLHAVPSTGGCCLHNNAWNINVYHSFMSMVLLPTHRRR